MKPYFALIAGLLLSAPLAQAQVSINQAALDQLAGIKPVVITAPPAIRQLPRKIAYRVPRRRRMTPAATARLAAARNLPKSASVPKPAPPVQQVVARPAPLPLAIKPATPPYAAIAFAAGASDLPAGVPAQLKPFCGKSGTGPITIDAYAAADSTDPSAAPRLSMSRAFALRDALTACGVPSASIIPRADGAAAKNPDIAVISAP